MPAATPMYLRQVIVKRREAGESYASIARSLAMPYQTVWKVDRHYRQQGHLEPNYAACQHKTIRKSGAIYARAVELKGAHPGWGANLIWVLLAEEWDEGELPSIRTLQRWFHRGKVARQRKQERVKSHVRRGQAPHEVWALDAKEQIQLQDGSAVSWLTISDEASGAVLTSRLFPPWPVEPTGSTGCPTGAASHDEPMG